MSINLIAIPVTIISSDSDLLIELAWTLSALGYQVETSSDWSEEAPWRWADRPGILLLDDPAPEQPGLNTTTRRNAHYLYRILIQNSDPRAAGDESAQIAADDVIRRPVNTGELLARLRAGMRRLELERRLLEKSVVDPESGLLSRAGFISRVSSQQGRGQADRSGALLLLQIHSYRQIRAEHGRYALRSLTAGLSRAIDKEIGNKGLVFLLEPGVMGVLLSDATLAEATAAAEGVVHRFGGCDTLAREVRCCPSVSAAVAACEDDDVEQTVRRCERALGYARCVGGGKVVLTEQAEQKIQSWKRDFAEGALLRDVVAHDVMEPFPALFPESEQGQDSMVHWLRSAARRGYPLPASLPVVQQRGQLVGLIDLAHADGACAPIADPIVRNAPTVAPDATLVQVLDALFDCSEGCLIVARDELPLGYITPDALTDLFAERVSPLRYYREPLGVQRVADFAVPLTPDAPIASPD
ncbi:MAG: hypothetical protein KDA44_11240 [Planctomycetales bacterium]|nr:hypothetical protein [Planctomycetales bacterium]